VAQGTAAKRFLTKVAKAASARIVLALAVAAFALSGCGGGSSDTSSSSAATSAEKPAAGAAAKGQAASEAAAEDAASEAPGGQRASGTQPSNGTKHGPAVPQPTGAPEPKITPQQRREATVADMILQSPSSESSSAGPQALPARYTCDGENVSPALSWRGVPPGTAELALLVMNIQPVEGKLFFDWAVAGLDPELEEIEAGKLPKGAIVGRNSSGKTGYEICPAGEGETYMFALFALPEKLTPSHGFDPLTFRKAVLDSSGNVGLLAMSYARG
jgi:phosphatidylethanolamine-binding protein (PEBP) family uncharacterized protein